jgi:hypothetical protein
MKNIIPILYAVFVLISCNKKPTADFTTGTVLFVAGDNIPLTNLSEDSKSYKWVMPDGRVSTNKNENYSLPIDLDTCTLIFELTAYSKRGNKSETIKKSVDVIPATGNVVFWKDASCACGTTTIIIGTVAAQITTNTSTVPVCGDLNTATFKLRIGNYSYSATDGTKTWNGNITITKYSCLGLQLI